MKIHLPSYPRGVHQIHETLTASDLGLDPETFSSPIEVRATLDRHDPYLEFDLELEMLMTSQCDRCLADFEWSLKGATPMLYVLGRLPAGDSVDDPGIVYLAPGTTDVDITSDVRDLALLSLPVKFLCRDDCRGICPVCGADLNLHQCGCSVEC